MNADGTNPVRLTNQSGDDFAPGWSPDGARLVFVSDRDQASGIYDLYIMNADGSDVVRLTDDPALDYSPDWSPDGARIVFRSHHDGPGDIYSINVDGSDLINLTNDPADDWAPSWSPDGSQIAFQTNRDNNWEIYRIAADGSNLVNLTKNPADDQSPHWQPAAAEVSPSTQQSTPTITARMLVEPGALMGPGPSSFAWSPGGAILAYLEALDGRDVLWEYEPLSAAKRVLFDPGENPDQIDLTSLQWSPQGDALLLNGASALWLLDSETGDLVSKAPGGSAKTSLAFSPDGSQISYVQDNDIYTIAIADNKITRLTTDGSATIFNGALDWVYNEELATRSAQPAYAWSPDGEWLIYLRLDEAGVQDHSVTDYRTVPPTLSYTRYPVAGSPNPIASLLVVSLETGTAARLPLDPEAEYILPFFTWFPDSQEAIYVTVNREHTLLELKAWSPISGVGRTLITETDPLWINENSYAAPIFLGDGSQFLWLSERDGFMHLYLYSRQGELIRQLTQGEWMIDTPAWNLLIPDRPVFIDQAGEWAYFSATKNSPLERQIYRVNIGSGALEQVSQQAGFHFGALSGDGQYLVDQFSDLSTPPITNILAADGTQVSILGQSAGPTLQLPDVSREFITLKAKDGVDLYAQMVKPENFDPALKYPVIVHWYAGPTLQMVSNRYGKTNLFNHIERDVLYTQAGFIVWRLDNRGSFGRGHAFETPIAKELGKAALDDQLVGIEYLRNLPYIDPGRIGCDGKSFGGYMSLYAMIHAPEIFKAGVVGSAPTRWEYYDTIYTERYMGLPSQNPEGYAATDLIAAAGDLEARPLIIHGLNDTNVHLQNSINLIEALESLDKPFEFLPLPNLNHSYKGDGLAAALSASVDYFTRMLGAIPTAEVAQETPPDETAAEVVLDPANNVPLQEALESLEPQAVFENFYAITQVPRPSGHMDKIRAFLVDFGNNLGLETRVDEAGNVLIRKPATAGFENRQGVVLQAHMDMVPQKTDQKAFDFTTDPIQAFVNGDYVVADGTTLGADDGIGIAIILTVLQDRTLQAGPVEALFTVDEESDMSGATGLKTGELQGKILINLDWETEGKFTIGSAGGEHVNIRASYLQAPAPPDLLAFQVKVQGLKGGHSGVDINLGRGHATKILVRLLKEAAPVYELNLANIVGGTASNAIPRDASAQVFIAADRVEAFKEFVDEFEATVQNELKAVEPDLTIDLTEIQSPGYMMEQAFQSTLIDSLYATPQGVLRMSDTVPDLVETSTNMGITTAQEGLLEVICYPRSSVDSELEDVGQMIGSVWELAGTPVEITDAYGGWTPDPSSPILGLMQTVYQELFGKEAEIVAVHAGLECGAIGETYPEMDMISIGPTLNDVHSPAERLYIPSVGRVMDLLVTTLQRIPEN
jgi:dipeptidase D